jgi:N6-adenosine-specific RNA methylase IME4
MKLNKKGYRLVYADPAWTYNNERTGGSLNSGSSQKYDTMSLEEICGLPVNNITANDSVLFLWVTVPLLPYGFKVLESWGFRYKTALFWRKIMSLGMGYWFRNQIEVLLVGIKGKVSAFRMQKANFIQTKAGKHSEKPKQVYGLLEKISDKFDLNPKIELFARNRREGWDVWGNDIPDTTQMLLTAK